MALNIAIYGYDTDLGKLVLETFDEIKVENANLYPLSPLDGEYDAVSLYGKNYLINYVENFDFSLCDVALFLTTKDESQRLIKKAQDSGCIVIDASHLYSGTQAPTLLPEVNPYLIKEVIEKRLAIPALSVSAAVVLTLMPLHDEFEVESINLTALESLSEHGRNGTETLVRETTFLLNGRSLDDSSFEAQVAFNLHTRIGELEDNGYSDHEKVIVKEINDLMGGIENGVDATAILVPVFFGHTISLHFTLKEKVSLDEVQKVLEKCEYLRVDDGKEQIVTPVTHGVNEKELTITRLRQSSLSDRGFDLVVVLDNTRRGEAVSCVKIAKLLADNIKS